MALFDGVRAARGTHSDAEHAAKAKYYNSLRGPRRLWRDPSCVVGCDLIAIEWNKFEVACSAYPAESNQMPDDFTEPDPSAFWDI